MNRKQRSALAISLFVLVCFLLGASFGCSAPMASPSPSQTLSPSPVATRETESSPTPAPTPAPTPTPVPVASHKIPMMVQFEWVYQPDGTADFLKGTTSRNS